jgi:hypothetical protein
VDIRVYQIYYKDSQRAQMAPEAIPLENTEGVYPHYYEYDVFMKAYTKGLTLGGYTGILSWKFAQKTKVPLSQWLEEIKKNPGYDVYLINPNPEQLAFNNVWEQGDYFHPHLIRETQKILDKLGYNIPLKKLVHDARTTSYCNYWIGSENFWNRYISFIAPLYNYMTQSLTPAEKKFFYQKADFKKLAPYFPYVFERMISTLLATDENIRVHCYSYSEKELQNKLSPQMAPLVNQLQKKADPLVQKQLREELSPGWLYQVAALRPLAHDLIYYQDKLKKKWRAKVGSGKTVFYLFQIQDLDVLWPLLQQFKTSGLPAVAIVSPELAIKSPRTLKNLKTLGIPILNRFRWLPRMNYLHPVGPVKAVITACDTSAGAHKRGFAFAKSAKARGVSTFTFQHGLENIGLNYADQEYPYGRIRFASDHIFTWLPLERLSSEMPQETKLKCVPMGAVKSYDDHPPLPFKNPREKLVVVFENLHSPRYSEEYRGKFMIDLQRVILKFPDTTFIVKPHHAGRWLTERFKGVLSLSENGILIDAKSPQWESYTAPSYIKIADAIITTPSTVAFDAAMLDTPAAIVGYDLDLPLYTPLNILRSYDDWKAFIEQDHTLADAKLKTFKSQFLTEDSNAENIVRYIADKAGIKYARP